MQKEIPPTEGEVISHSHAKRSRAINSADQIMSCQILEKGKALNMFSYRNTRQNAENNPHQVSVDEDWMICQPTGRSPVLLR